MRAGEGAAEQARLATEHAAQLRRQADPAGRVTPEAAVPEASVPEAPPETLGPRGPLGSGRRRQQHPQPGAVGRRRSKGNGRHRQSSRSRRSGILGLIVLGIIVVALWSFAGNAVRSAEQVPPAQTPQVNSQTTDASP